MFRPKPALAAALFVAAGLAQATTQVQVVFDDAAGLYSAYYGDIERATSAAGDAWFANIDTFGSGAQLTVMIGFAGIATSTGRSLSSAYVGTGGDGIHLYEQGAAHKLATGVDTNGAAPDIEINLGIDGYLQGELWFDPTPALRLVDVPSDRTDAVSVLLHEFGHALGFNGWRDGTTGALPGKYQSTFDARVAMDWGLQGSTLVFAGDQSSRLYGAPLPLTWSSYGHLGNPASAPGADLVPDLMNGVTFYRGTRYSISPLDLAVMQDIGLPMLAAVPEPGSTALWLAGLSLLAAVRWRKPRAARGAPADAPQARPNSFTGGLPCAC